MRVMTGVLALTACASLLGAAYSPPATNPAAAPAGSYTIEPGHTQITFTVWHFGLTQYRGVFPEVSGTLAWDPANPAAIAAEIHVPTSLVRTTSAELDKRLRGPDWLDTVRYPDMLFRLRNTTRTGPSDGAITGDLTLHGQTHPITFAAHYNGSAINPFSGKRDIGLTLTGRISRSAWGVGAFIPMVSDNVTIDIAAAFEHT